MVSARDTEYVLQCWIVLSPNKGSIQDFLMADLSNRISGRAGRLVASLRSMNVELSQTFFDTGAQDVDALH